MSWLFPRDLNVEGIEVEVIRKAVRRINLSVTSEGKVRLTVPRWHVSLRTAEEFLRSKLDWVRKTREKVLSRPRHEEKPSTAEELAALVRLLDELNAQWSERLGERGVSWRIRKVKTYWGSCNWRKRLITYNESLSHAPRELVEYVVVHEYTHFKAHNHGPQFYALMDERLPSWKTLRRRLHTTLAQ